MLLFGDGPNVKKVYKGTLLMYKRVQKDSPAVISQKNLPAHVQRDTLLLICRNLGYDSVGIGTFTPVRLPRDHRAHSLPRS